jgi:DNA-binding IclR family transcriptional regulator
MTEISSTGDLMLSVLEVVAERGPVTAAECARACDINRTVAHRLLTTLALRLYVVKGQRGYVIGPGALALGHAGSNSLAAVARPEMARLAGEIRETVVLQTLSGQDAVVLDQALDASHLVVVRHNPGSRHPLHRGASGLAILAHQPERTIDGILAGVAADEAAALVRTLQSVRDKGFAHTRNELQLGVHGLAAPIFVEGQCRASLAVLVPESRAETLAAHSARLVESAAAISGALTA